MKSTLIQMVKRHLTHTIFIILICDGLNVSCTHEFVMLVHNIFCCVYSEEIPEDSSLSGSEDEGKDVMLSPSSNSSGTFTEPVFLHSGSGGSTPPRE